MNKEAMTAVEVAEILKIAPNTVYELVKRGELNCYRVGRKMRFSYQDIQAYINAGRGFQESEDIQDTAEEQSTGNKVSELEGTWNVPLIRRKLKDVGFRFYGKDSIIDELIKYMNLDMPGLNAERIDKGSYDSLIALYKDEAMVAACHIWDPITDSYNIPYIKRLLPGCRTVLIHLGRRLEGFFVAEGNPKNITSWEDLKRDDLVIANREPGAGTRILLDQQMMRLGLEARDIRGYEHECVSHMAVAVNVGKGIADFGIGTEKTIKSMNGLEFVPLQMEEYDLVLKKDDFYRPSVQLMLKILQSEAFRELFAYMKGYDLSHIGEVTFLE